MPAVLREHATRPKARRVAMHFIFPRDLAQPAHPDEMFAGQWAALTQVGFTASLCTDSVLTGTKALRNVPAGCQAVYRGWMLKAEEYAALVRAIDQCGATAYISAREYLA